MGPSLRLRSGGFGGAERRTVAKIRTWYLDEANELDRMRQEVEELKRKLAACEAKLRKR